MVGAFNELMPGVPWSNELKEELYTQLCREGAWEVDLQVQGYDKVTVMLLKSSTTYKKVTTHSLEAVVSCFRGVSDHPIYPELGYCAARKSFPNTAGGVVQAFEFIKEAVNHVKRRGFCQGCLGKERPRKRIRMSTGDLCGQCFMQRLGDYAASSV